MIPEIHQHEAELKKLCLRFRVLSLEVFGSAAKGHFRPGDSDLDFLVEFAPPIGPGYADR